MNHQLLEHVLESPRLPSLPSVAIEVIELVQRQDVNIKRIAHTIQNDPALACKILKTVNSSFYGQSYSVSTVTHALVVLGLNSVKTLALGFSLVGNLRKADAQGFDYQQFWRRSLYSATAAKTLAQRAGLAQEEEAFLGGLLQDMGMLAMNQTLGEDYAALLTQVGDDHAALGELEKHQWDLTHSQVGAALAERWKLPPLLVAPLKYHEQPDEAEEEVQVLVRSVALGNRVAEVFIKGQNELDADRHVAAGSGQPTDPTNPSALDTFHQQAHAWFNLSRDQSQPLLKQIHSQTADMARLFDLPTGGVANPDAILARANETLMNLTLETQQQNRQLNNDAYTDALTGVSNRRAFDEQAPLAFNQASADSPLSVLFIDIDHFKHFNDTHGHAVGDQVLNKVGHTLSQTLGKHGRAFRYGGEEFAVLCTGVGRRLGAGLAERMRRTIEAQTADQNAQGVALSVTLSIGVACYAGQTFERVEQLIQAADKSVYAAKASGRNCVRVYMPKARPKPRNHDPTRDQKQDNASFAA